MEIIVLSIIAIIMLLLASCIFIVVKLRLQSEKIMEQQRKLTKDIIKYLEDKHNV